jgi:hypothetical protein
MRTILLSVLALGATSAALAEPITLMNDQMDKVKAGAGGCSSNCTAGGFVEDSPQSDAQGGYVVHDTVLLPGEPG